MKELLLNCDLRMLAYGMPGKDGLPARAGDLGIFYRENGRLKCGVVKHGARILDSYPTHELDPIIPYAFESDRDDLVGIARSLKLYSEHKIRTRHFEEIAPEFLFSLFYHSPIKHKNFLDFARANKYTPSESSANSNGNSSQRKTDLLENRIRADPSIIGLKRGQKNFTEVAFPNRLSKIVKSVRYADLLEYDSLKEYNLFCEEKDMLDEGRLYVADMVIIELPKNKREKVTIAEFKGGTLDEVSRIEDNVKASAQLYRAATFTLNTFDIEPDLVLVGHNTSNSVSNLFVRYFNYTPEKLVIAKPHFNTTISDNKFGNYRSFSGKSKGKKPRGRSFIGGTVGPKKRSKKHILSPFLQKALKGD